MEYFRKSNQEKKISLNFYEQSDVLHLSKNLLGKILLTHFNGTHTGGMIVETESYKGAEDKACHAYQNRKTARTEVMFETGGVAYVYLCYGMHHLFNIVTNKKNIPHAILIRAIEPLYGIETMLKRRQKKKIDRSLTAGPGSLTQALGIQCKHSKTSLIGDSIWIEDHGHIFLEKEVIASPRVGVSYAEDHALFPWRFRLKNNSWTSIAK